MYQKYYTATIEGNYYDNGYEISTFSRTSDKCLSIESLTEWVKEHNWEVGKKAWFPCYIWDFDSNKERKTKKQLTITKITYRMYEEFITRESKEIDINGEIPETLLNDNIIGIEMKFGDKTYRTLCNGDNYGERVLTYLHRKGLEMPHGGGTVSVFEPKDKDIILW